MRQGRRLLALLIVLFINTLSKDAYAQKVLPEYTIKAGYLYHFGLLTDWPEPVLDSNFQLCYLSGYDMSVALASLKGKRINGRPIDVYHVKNASDIDLDEALKIIRVIKGLPVLTVTDDESLFDRGAAIFMRPEGHQLVFEIDNEVAKSAQLDISSRLLRLGR